MRSLQSYCVPAALIPALLLSMSVAAGDSRSRPFTAILDGRANPVFVDGCTIDNTEGGTGHATHMGRITWSTTETVDSCTTPDVALVEGRFKLVDGNGDELTGTYRTVAKLDFVTSEVMAAGLYWISGGTGPFANASGSGVISADGSLLAPFDVIGQLTGTVGFRP